VGTRHNRPVRSVTRRYPVAAFTTLAFVLTWSVWLPRALVSQGVLAADWPVAVGAVWSWAPAIAAVLTAALIGRGALRELASRLIRWRVRWWWYAVVLLGPAAFWSVVVLLAAVLGWSGELGRSLLAEQGPLAAAGLLLVLAVTDGLGEETGWRGFALPRALKWLLAGAVIGAWLRTGARTAVAARA
jgi:membrane protease YdiL (CAAX protease family)